jgi:hypothetical protein
MQFSAEIWRPSENIHDIHALGDFSNLIGEKSPIRRQSIPSKSTNSAQKRAEVLNIGQLLSTCAGQLRTG